MVLLTVCSTAASASAGRAAGASFPAFDGTPWSTTKTGSSCACWRQKSPPSPVKHAEHRRTGRPLPVRRAITVTGFGRFHCRKAALSKTVAGMVSASQLAGDPSPRLTAAPARRIDWWSEGDDRQQLVRRPSGTEDAYKICCEVSRVKEHRKRIEKEAVEIVNSVLAAHH